ncbi:MAG: thiamine biosynthesis protein [Acidimicrobiales bacterium]|nr:thiamine biosynthesis protein [Acidimicrobiales bacterium]
MTAVAPEAPIRRVERVMGTAFGITVLDPIEPAAVDEAYDWLRWVDATFSTYEPGSEISRLRRGELGLDDTSPEVREVLNRCAELTELTDGWFTIRSTPADALDPSGLVKGWSIDRTATILRMAGATTFSVNGGGDIVCGLGPGPGGVWRVGVRHPDESGSLAAVLDLRDRAIATSGTYERGDHIWGGRSAGPGLLSATVVGPELGTADALATALFADGSGLPTWLERFGGYDALVVTGDRRVRWTPGFDQHLVPPPVSPSPTGV